MMSEVPSQRGGTPSATSHSGTSSPLLSNSRSTQYNRKYVVVDDGILSNNGRSSNSPARDDRVVTVGQRTSDKTSSHSHQGSGELPCSPPNRGSDGSLHNIFPRLLGLAVPLSSEKQLVEELKGQIISSGTRAFQLEKDTQDVVKLKKIIAELEKDRSRLSNELLDNQVVVGSLKQKVSMLHEQNGQLAKLVQSEKGGSAEMLAVRNTLAASLAQLKKLDEQVRTIPLLKKQLHQLTEENSQLKMSEAVRLPEQLPEGVKPADYLTLKAENQELHAKNNMLADQLQQLGVQLKNISSFSDSLRKDMETIENVKPANALLEARIHSLEQEKDQLYQEILDLKSHHVPLDIDSAQLYKQVTELEAANSLLRNRMEQLKTDTRQQKEQLLFGLLEMEALNVKAKKHELENRILAVEQSNHSLNDVHRNHLISPSPEPRAVPDDDLEEVASTQPPEYRSQLLKIKQLEVHIEQSHKLLHNLLCERTELQAKVSELENVLEEKGIEEQKRKLEGSERTLSLAREKISMLEKELRPAHMNGVDAQQALSAEDRELKAQLTMEQKQYIELKKSFRMLEEKCHAQEVVAEKAELLKVDKKKAEKKLKEIKKKYSTVATELTNCVELMKNYQIQCVSLAEELEKSKAELKGLREEHAGLKARLEVEEVEKNVGLEGQIEGAVVAEMRSKCECLESQQTLTLKKCEELECKLQEEQRRLIYISTENATLNAKLIDLEEHKTRLEVNLEEAHQTKASLLQDRTDLEAVVGVLRNKELGMKDLETRLHKLKSENAELATEVGNLQQKLALVLNDLSVRSQSQEQQLAKLSGEKEGAEATIRELKGECDSLRLATHSLRQQLATSQEEMSQKIAILQADLDRSEGESDKVLAEKRIISSELDREKQRMVRLTEAVATSERELASSKSELVSIGEVIKTLNARLEQQSSMLKEKEQKLILAEKELQQIQTLKSELKDAIDKKTEVSSDTKVKEQRISDLEATHQKKTEEIRLLQQKIDSLEKDLKSLRSDLANASKRTNSLNTQFDEVSASLRAEHEKSRSLEKELKQLQTKEIPKLKAELEMALNEKKAALAEVILKKKQLSEVEQTLAAKLQELDAVQQSSKVSIEGFAHRVTSLEEALEVSRSVSTNELRKAEAEHAKVSVEHAKIMLENEKHLKQSQGELQAARLEMKNLQLQLDSLRASQRTLTQDKLELERRCVLVPQLEQSVKNHMEQLKKAQQRDSAQSKQLEELQNANRTLSNQVEGYVATISSLTRKLDDAESKEIELEELKRKIQKAMGDSSQLKQDNKQLLALFRDLPNYSSEANETLREENRKLEQQVSILSQWNDKQREKLDALEKRVDDLSAERDQLHVQLTEMEGAERENAQLRQELKEIEMEVRSLKRRAQVEFNEETKVKLQTQSQLLQVFNEHNTKLQKQVKELVAKVLSLGGELERRTAASPPPMPDSCIGLENGGLHRTLDANMINRISELEEENKVLQQRLAELGRPDRFKYITASARRRSAAFNAISSIPMTPETEEVPVIVPHEMLLPLSLLADALGTSPEANTPQTTEYMNSISKGWFACMSQKTLTLNCAECYVTTVSRLSSKLLVKVINLQDDKGNTALHYAVANEKFDIVALLISFKICNTNVVNNAGYTPVMLGAAYNVSCDGDESKCIMKQLIGTGDVNARFSHDGQTALMLAASSGSLELVNILIECGADVNLQNKDGSTALMFACENRNIEIVKRLLEVPGCNAGLEDNDRKTALKIATEAGHKEMRSLLNNFLRFSIKAIRTK